MEQSKPETLNLSDSLFPFPPHRPRHLKSQTFSTLVRILSQCHVDSQPSHSHDPPVPQQQVPKPGEVCGEEVACTSMECEILSIQTDVSNSESFVNHKCLNEDRMETDEVGHVNRMEADELVNILEDKSNNVVSLIDNQEGQCSLLEICMEELLGNVEVNEALDVSLDIDVIAESRKLDENNEGGSSFEERNMLEEVGHRMQLMESDKLVSNCSAMNSPVCDEEIEEGEISGDCLVKSMDLLAEDAVSLEKKGGEEQSSEAINEEWLTSNEQKGAIEEDSKSDKNFVETVDNAGNGVELKLIESNMQEMVYGSQMDVFEKTGEAKLPHVYESLLENREKKKQASGAKEKFNHPAVPGEISGENATESQGMLSTEKGSGVRKRKKRGGKKEKKKQNEKIKRAEKNRLLGVKRLKIQPILKPKTVTSCRHFIKGRCQQGDECKFSHDAIPLTKSKPCCHFARHSCMKGDDCPFDHQLSKYHCDNYTSRGSCSRGSNCMFSHEIPLMEGSPSTINVSKPEINLSSLLRGTNSDKQSNLHNSAHQKFDSKSGSTLISSSKNTELNVAETPLKPALQTPKGIGNLLFGMSSLGNPSKLKQGGSSLKEDGGVKFGFPSTMDMAQHLKETSKTTAAVQSKGINFLSFGKVPLHDSSSKKPPSSPFSRDCGIQQTTFGDSSMDKQAASSLNKVCIQTSQSLRDMVQNFGEIPMRTPALPPLGINFLSCSKAPLGDSSDAKLASMPSNGDNVVMSLVRERESAPKLQIPSSKPWKLLSSSIPSDQSLDQLADGHGKNTTSSFLKALLLNTPNSVQKTHLSNVPNSAQKSLQSMLAFAAKYESKIKMNHPDVSADFNKASSSSQNT